MSKASKPPRSFEAFEDETTPKADPEEVRQLKDVIKNLTKRLRGLRSGEELIKAAVDEAFTELPDLRLVPPPKSIGKGKLSEIHVLMISDSQIGKVTESYNSGVAEARILHAGRAVIRIANLRRKAAKSPRIKLYLLGDEIEGENIFPGQAHEIDSGAFEQSVLTGPSIFVKLIRLLLTAYETVEVWTVPGNHGRVAFKSVTMHPRTNWDNVCHHVIHKMLHSESRVKWRLSEHWYQVDKDLNLMMVHGHQIRGGFAGFPWYGVARKALSWAESVKEWQGSPRYLAHGHFHQQTCWPQGTIWILGNGTVESHNEYARAEIGLAGDPTQRFSVFSPEKILLADHALYLSDVQ